MNLLKSFLGSLVLLLSCTMTSNAQITVGSMVVGQGVTDPNDWLDYSNLGIYVDVNTSACGFTQTPHYLVTLESRSGYQWEVSGVPSIYNITPTGFRVYLRWTDHPSDRSTIGSRNFPNPLRASTARDRGWVIRWTAISTGDCAMCDNGQSGYGYGEKSNEQPAGSPFGEEREHFSPDGGILDEQLPAPEKEMGSASFEEGSEEEALSVYPNPSNTEITVSSVDAIEKVELYSLNGQLLKSSTETTLNVKDLSPGEYIVKAYFSDRESITRKIIRK